MVWVLFMIMMMILKAISHRKRWYASHAMLQTPAMDDGYASVQGKKGVVGKIEGCRRGIVQGRPGEFMDKCVVCRM